MIDINNRGLKCQICERVGGAIGVGIGYAALAFFVAWRTLLPMFGLLWLLGIIR